MAQAYDAATNNKRIAAQDAAAAEEHFKATMNYSPQHITALSYLEKALRRRIDFAVARPSSAHRDPSRVSENVHPTFWEDLDTDVIEFGLRRAFPGCDAHCSTTGVDLRWDPACAQTPAAGKQEAAAAAEMEQEGDAAE